MNSEMTLMTSMIRSQILWMTVRSSVSPVNSANRPPMVSYDSNRLTVPNILYHAQRQSRNLSCEIQALAFAQVQQPFHLFMGHFNTPPSSVKFKGLVGVNAHVRSNEGVPGAIALLVEEELDVHTGIPGLDGCGLISDGPVAFGLPGLFEFGDDIWRGEVAQGCPVLGPTHLLDHPDDMALEVAAVDELKEFRAGEPAVNQQVVEPGTFQNSLSEHLDGVGNSGLEHFRLAGIDLLVLTASLAILGGLLLLGKPLWLIGIFPCLCLYGGVHHQLCLAVRVAEEQGFKPQDAPHDRMGKHLSKAFRFVSRLGRSVSSRMTQRVSPLASAPATGEGGQLPTDGVSNTAPVNTSVIHDAIERVLLAGEQLAKRAALIVGRCLHGEERLQDELFHQLDEGEPAVRILNRTYRFGLYDEALHHFADRVDCLTSIVVFEKVFEFRDYLSIFIHG